MRKITDGALYLVITEEYCRGRKAIDVARAAIAGSVDIIQMREKDKNRQELLSLGKKLARLCRENRVTFIVNDDPVIAKECGADGVHLGQEDMRRISIEDAKRTIGPHGIVGVSTHSLEEFKLANASFADYIAYGPVFATKLKKDCVGTKNIATIISLAKKPVFFIGGINLCNIEELIIKGARNAAVIRAISEAEDIKEISHLLKKELSKKEE